MNQNQSDKDAEFRRFLEAAAKEVASWPEWKRKWIEYNKVVCNDDRDWYRYSYWPGD